jgi:CRISPR-associated protein Cas2
MFCVVSYDIPDNKRRRKLAKIIMDYGDRVQYSVFECILDKKLLDKMIRSIYETVSEDEDSVRIYTLCAGCVKDIAVIGCGEVSEDKDVYII